MRKSTEKNHPAWLIETVKISHPTVNSRHG